MTIRNNDEMISRRHVSLELTPTGLLATDVGSRNGTRLDGSLLSPNNPKLTRREGILELGNHVFQIALIADDEQLRLDRQRARRARRPFFPKEFELLGEIGEGATGRVYAAHHKLLRRNVAIKVLSTGLADEATEQGRFLRGAHLCGRVNSPYVVVVHDLRVADNTTFLVMLRRVRERNYPDFGKLTDSRLDFLEQTAADRVLHRPGRSGRLV